MIKMQRGSSTNGQALTRCPSRNLNVLSSHPPHEKLLQVILLHLYAIISTSSACTTITFFVAPTFRCLDPRQYRLFQPFGPSFQWPFELLYIERSTRKDGIDLGARTCPSNQRDDDNAFQLMLFAIIMSDHVLLLQTHCRSNSRCLSRQT